MKKVTSADSLVIISHYKNLLQSEGIEAFIRNEHLGSIMGEMPFQEVWPELWVRNDLDLDRAKQLIDTGIEQESPADAWACRQCGADNEGQFALCWQCQAAGPDGNS
jgi:putative signal transducing protein